MKLISNNLTGFISLVLIIMFFQMTIHSEGINPLYPSENDFVELEVMPEMIYQETPVYPEEAKKQGIEGTVWIKTLIDNKGNVVKTKVGKSCGNDMLDNSAVLAAEKFKFKPGIQNGIPVACWMTFKTEFVLDDKAETTPQLQNQKDQNDFVIENLNIMPELIFESLPEYPDRAKKSGPEGYVWVMAFVNEEGRVIDVKIQKASCEDCGFIESAEKAAWKYKFKPAVKDGKTASAWVTFKIEYRLDGK
ncbi:MAG: energy transducer TonB [Candidatus Zixiibacteriota bacterium]